MQLITFHICTTDGQSHFFDAESEYQALDHATQWLGYRVTEILYIQRGAYV